MAKAEALVMYFEAFVHGGIAATAVAFALSQIL